MIVKISGYITYVKLGIADTCHLFEDDLFQAWPVMS